MSHVGSDYQLFHEQEVVEGTPDTTVEAKAVAQHQRVNSNLPSNLIELIQSGSLTRLLEKGIASPMLQVTYIVHAKGPVTLLKDSVLGTNPFTLYVRHTSGTPLLVYKGMKAASTILSTSIYPSTALATVTQMFKGLDIQTTLPTGVTFQTWPTTRLALTDVVVKKAAVALTDWHSFRLNVENRLEALPNPATGLLRTQKLPGRRITGEIVKDFADFTEYTDIVNSVAATLAFELGATTPDVYTVSNAKWEDVDPPIGVEDLIAKRLPFIGGGLTVA